MDKSETYLRLFNSQQLDDSMLLLHSLLEDGLEVLKISKKLLDDSEILKTQYFLFFLVLRKSSSICQLLSQDTFFGSELLDVSSIQAIGRASYETALISASFGLKPVKNETELLRYLLWRLSAEKNRLQVKTVPLNIKDELNSKITSIISSIKELKLYDKNRNVIDRCIQKKIYHISKKNDLIQEGNWRDYESRDLGQTMLMLQSTAHPSAIAVDNFANMLSSSHSDRLALLQTSIVFLTYATYVNLSLCDMLIQPKYSFYTYLTKDGQSLRF
jgi:hypothetical protein